MRHLRLPEMMTGRLDNFETVSRAQGPEIPAIVGALLHRSRVLFPEKIDLDDPSTSVIEVMRLMRRRSCVLVSSRSAYAQLLRTYGLEAVSEIWKQHTAIQVGELSSVGLIDVFTRLLGQLERSVASNLEHVVAFGSGTATDWAKLIGARLGVPTICFPTSISTNAPMVYKAAVWIDGRKRSIETGACSQVHFDYRLIGNVVSERFNDAGFGDVISCYTALADWGLAASQGHDDTAIGLGPSEIDGRSLYAALFRGTEHILSRLMQANAAVTREARHRFCASLLCDVSRAVASMGLISSDLAGRIDAGCEHQLAFAIETLLPGQRLVHGELVTFSTYAMAALYERVAPSATVLGKGISCATVHQITETLRVPIVSRELAGLITPDLLETAFLHAESRKGRWTMIDTFRAKPFGERRDVARDTAHLVLASLA